MNGKKEVINLTSKLKQIEFPYFEYYEFSLDKIFISEKIVNNKHDKRELGVKISSAEIEY